MQQELDAEYDAARAEYDAQVAAYDDATDRYERAWDAWLDNGAAGNSPDREDYEPTDYPSDGPDEFDYRADQSPDRWAAPVAAGVGLAAGGGTVMGVAALGGYMKRVSVSRYQHWFSDPEVDALIRDFNEQLRQELGLSPEEVAPIELGELTEPLRRWSRDDRSVAATRPRVTPLLGVGFVGIGGRF